MIGGAERVVAREAELGELADLIELARVAPAGLILLGAAGIGKTTLWAAGVQAARSCGYQVLVSRPVEAESKMAFAALTDLLGTLLEESLVHLPGAQKQALEVALLRAEIASPPPEPRLIGAAVLSILDGIASAGPLLVAIDDIHWLDTASASALGFALRRVKRGPVAVLAAQRLGMKSPLDLKEVGGTEVHRLVVGPVDRVVIDRILRSRLHADLRPPTVRRIHAAAGGNPFFALEIARAIVERGEPPPGESLPIPNNLLELTRRRVTRLPEPSRRALTAAALLANPRLEFVSRHGEVELSPALEADLIIIEGNTIRFTHPLIASTLVERASPLLLRKLHREIAGALDDPEERARHLALSTDQPSAAIAATLEEAAISAGQRGAPTVAAELAERAWKLTPCAAVEDVNRRKILEAEQLLMAGDYPGGRSLLQEGIAALPAGPLRARALLSLGVDMAHELSDWAGSFAILQQATDEAGTDPRVCFETERQLGHSLKAEFHAADAEPHLRRALALAEKLGNPVLLAEALAEVADVDFNLGLGIHHELVDRALSLGTLNDHARVFRNPLWSLFQMFLDVGELSRAREALQTLLRIALERGEESAPAWILFKIAEVEIAAGNYEVAEDYARRSHEVSVQTAQEAPRMEALAALADINAYRGRIDEAREFWQPLLTDEDLIWQLEARGTLGMIELSIGDAERAWAYLAPSAEGNEKLGLNEPTIFPHWADAIEALIALGKLDEAAPRLAWLEERGSTLNRSWAIATGARCRGLLLAATGDFVEALNAVERSLAAHDSLPIPYERARTLLAKGMIERRAKKKRSARESLGQALVAFEKLGARQWAQKTLSELHRIGGRTRPGGLTETERRIAQLVADGQSNQAIARAMFLSVKTVEANLSRIYLTLGISSRTALTKLLLTETAVASDSATRDAAERRKQLRVI